MFRRLIQSRVDRFQEDSLLGRKYQFHNKFPQDMVANLLSQKHNIFRLGNRQLLQLMQTLGISSLQDSDSSYSRSYRLRKGCRCCLDKDLKDNFQCL
jgi:hypothetical protein